jgi:SAM-dependent methyltransferase
MVEAGDPAKVADFLVTAYQRFQDVSTCEGVRSLDFGCGDGQVAAELRRRGFDAYGCDLASDYAWGGVTEMSDRVRPIPLDPYRIPFDDAEFDFVTSVAVMEHAQNTTDCYREIHRVLRPGGIAVHFVAGKWYLPSEPHLFVPLLNWFWPHPVRPWLALWARLGVRNEHQQDLPWREVMHRNEEFYRDASCWRSSRYHTRATTEVFGACAWPMDFMIEHGFGGAAKLARRLPARRVSGVALREFRWGLLLQRKATQP